MHHKFITKLVLVIIIERLTLNYWVIGLTISVFRNYSHALQEFIIIDYKSFYECSYNV